jgi:hypothetical protein
VIYILIQDLPGALDDAAITESSELQKIKMVNFQNLCHKRGGAFRRLALVSLVKLSILE